MTEAIEFTTDAMIDADATAERPAPTIYPHVTGFKQQLAVIVRENRRDQEKIDRLESQCRKREERARNLRRQIRDWGGTLPLE